MKKSVEVLRTYLIRKNLFWTGLAAIALGIFIVWYRQPVEEPPVEAAEQALRCVLWRNNIDLELASLRTKYITDRDLYLLQHHTNLKTLVDSELTPCSVILLQTDDVSSMEVTLETLAVQLSQKDDTALRSIAELQRFFAGN